MAVLSASTIFAPSRNPPKAEIIQFLDMIQGAGSNPAVVKQTKAALDLVTPASENYGGLVLNDPTASNNGYYYRSSSTWVKGRGFPDTFAVLTSIGGTANAITASTEAGVNPADVLCVLLPDPPGTNSSSTVTLALNGGSAVPVKAASGSNLTVGDIIDGVGTLFFKVGNEWRQLFSSATGATFDHQGDWNGITPYTEAQIVTGSNGNWYQLKVPSSLGDDPVSGGSGDWIQVLDAAALPDGAVTEPKLATTVTATLPVIAESIATMKALSTNRPVLVRSYYGDGRGGGGLFVPDAGDAVSTDNGGTVIVRSDGIRMKRDNANLRDIDVLEWGVSSELADNSTRYDAIIVAAEDGAVIRWTKSDGAYLGHFLNDGTGKSFRLEGQGAQVSNVLDNQPVISQRGTVALATTATNTAVYGATSINVASVAGLAVGDLIYVHDNKSYNSVFANTELLKIRSISSLTIGVADMFRSNQDSGTINIYKLTPLKDPSIHGFEVALSDTHFTNVLSIWYAERPHFQDNIIRNSTGRPVDIRWCHAPFVNNTRIIEPRAVDSGEGYGVSLSDSRDITVLNTFARGCRHAVDCEAVYGGEIRNTTNEAIPGKQSLTVVAPCHVGYGGNVVIDGVYGHGISSYGVGISSQGLANPNGHVTRDWTIRDVRVVGDLAVDQQSYGVYIQMAYSGLTIDGVQFELPPGGNLNTLAAACVRINGQCHGFSLIQGVRSARATAGLIITVDGTIPGGLPSIGILSIKDVFLNACNHGIWLRGVKHIETHSLGASLVLAAVRTVITPHNGITTTTNITIGNSAVVS